MQFVKALLSGFGLIALTSSAPIVPSTSGSLAASITFWQDTPTQKHHCNGRDIIRCEMPGAEIADVCITIDTCESFCFLHDNSAACVDMDAPPVPKVPVSAKVAARSASFEENEHNECSKDHTGVLICKFGFCSTNYYCKASDACQDGSFVCAPKSLPLGTLKFEVRDMPAQAEVSPVNLEEKPSYTCSKDRASVLRCLYGFCSTEYYCAKGHPCRDNPARCKKAQTAQSEQ